MGLSDNNGNWSGTIFKSEINAPSLIDEMKMLFTDVEAEGKKQGYERAAAEYEIAFRAIKTEYKKTKELINSQKSTYGKQTDVLIKKLEALERQKRELGIEVERKTKAVSKKYDIPYEMVQSSCVGGYFREIPVKVDILSMIYRHKEKKLQEAERRGYLEAKELYEAKLDKLKRDLASLKNKGNAEIRKLLSMMDDILEAIAEEKMKIAELKILL